MKAKRCPFCNGHDLTVGVNVAVYWISCRDCGCCGPVGISANRACKRWNGEGVGQNPSAMVVSTNNRGDLKEIE